MIAYTTQQTREKEKNLKKTTNERSKPETQRIHSNNNNDNNKNTHTPKSNIKEKKQKSNKSCEKNTLMASGKSEQFNQFNDHFHFERHIYIFFEIQQPRVKRLQIKKATRKSGKSKK